MAEDENINDHIRNMMAALEMEPKASSFDAVMKKMERKKKRRFFFILFAGLGLLAGALLLSLPDAGSSAAKPVEVTEVVRPSIHEEAHMSTKPSASSKLKPASGDRTPAISTSSKSHPGTRLPATEPVEVASRPSDERKDHAISKTHSASEDQPKLAAHATSHSAAQSVVTEPVEVTSVSSGIRTDHTDSKANPVSEDQPKAGSIPATSHSDARSPVSGSLATEPVEATNKENSTTTNDPSAGSASFIFLDPRPLKLCTAGSLALPDSLIPSLTMLPKANLNELQKAKRSFSLLMAIGITPQLGAGLFWAGKNYSSPSSTLFDRRTDEFQSQYIEIKRKQNVFQLNYLYNFKLGFVFDNTWELWLSVGRQTIQYNEKIYSFASGSPVLISPIATSSAYNTGSEPGGIGNTFNYWSYGVEVNRLIRPRRSFQLKLGAGLHINNLSISHYVYAVSDNRYSYSSKNDPASGTVYIADLNCGIIQPLGRRFQLRASPGLFCSLNSMFNSNYVISQRSCGFQLEVALAFRVFTK